MSPGLLSFIISFLNAVTCTDFSRVRILESCKNQEDLPRICIKVSSVDKEYVSYLGGGCVSARCVFSARAMAALGVLFQHGL